MRGDYKFTAIDILIKILKERTIQGSTTSSGFICGDIPAVCLQEAPLYSLAQNLYTEQEYRAVNTGAKIRYMPIGLMFPKNYICELGGRPVIYDKTEIAKQFLSLDQHWRIVNFNLEDQENIIDWTHEREWRIPNQLQFDLDKVTVLLSRDRTYQLFIEECRKISEIDIVSSIRGIVNLGAVFY